MKRIVATLLAAACLNASAADWKLASVGEKFHIFVDTTSISKYGKNHKAWTIWSYDESLILDDHLKTPYRSLKQLTYFDCALKRSENIHTIYYEGDLGTGKTQKSAAYKFDAKDMVDIAPETDGDEMLNFVCKPSKKK